MRDIPHLDISDFGKSRLIENFDLTQDGDIEGNIRLVQEVIVDLQSRFPRIRMPKFYLFSGVPKNPSICGVSDLDHLYGKETFICLGNLDTRMAGRYSYCHKDERGKRDIVRHEIGHILTTLGVIDGWLIIHNYQLQKLGMSEYREWIEQELSSYAKENGFEEKIAEAFSIYTDNDCLKKRGIDDLIKEFVEENMVGNPIQIVEDSKVAEDEEYVYVRIPPQEACTLTRSPQRDGFHFDVCKQKFIPIAEWEKTFIELKIPKRISEANKAWLKRKIAEIEKRKQKA